MMSWGISTFTMGSWQFLFLLFFINYLGEGGVPFPFIFVGVMATAGYLLAQGAPAVGAGIVAIGVLGSLAGALTVYGIARWFGGEALRRLWKWLRLKPGWIEQVSEGAPRPSMASVAQARLIPGVATAMTVTAGVSRVPWVRFAGGVLVAEAIWTAPIVGVGYAMGLTALDLHQVAARVPGGVALFAGATIAVRLVRYFQRRRKASLAS